MTSPTLALAAEPWQLTRKRVYIMPTRHGWSLAFVLIVMLLGATNYNNSLAFMLTFLLAGVALVSMLHTYRELAGLSVQVAPATPVFAGDMARFPVHVINPDRLERLGVVLRRGRRDDAGAIAVALAGGQHAEVELPIHAPRRGWLEPDRVCIASRAPIGVFRAWSWVPCRARCLVYPRPLGDQPLPALGRAEHDTGVHRSSGDEEFSGLKPYRPGDPPRRIHWRAAGRSDPPPVKQFDANAGPELLLDYHDVHVSEPEARIAQLAAWVLEAADRDMSYALALPGERIEAARGPAHRDHCLRVLALHGSHDAASR